MTREEVLKYIIYHLKQEIGFTEIGLVDKSSSEEDVRKMKALMRKYKQMIKYVNENLK